MTLHGFLTYLADFGDSAVLTALVFVTAFYLLWCKHHNEALALVASLIVASCAIAGLKLIMISCGGGLLGIHSPSGHSAISISVFGTFGLILAQYFRSWRRLIPKIVFFALGFTIAVSRVVMNLHSVGEVVLGILVGLASIALVRFLILNRGPINLGNPGHFSVYVMIAIMTVVALSMHGTRLPAEMFIQHQASKIKHSLAFCS